MSRLLELRTLTKRFAGLTAVNCVDMSVEKGAMVGIIGPNGAGKTTLFNIVAGALQPTDGAVVLDGKNITRLPCERRCELGVARTFQIPKPFAGMTTFDNVLVGALVGSRSMAGDRLHTEEVLDLMQMRDYAQWPASSLTIGLRKRLELARALATGPKLLLLDEVMGGLHGEEVGHMIETIRRINETGVTVVMIEHVLQAVTALCQHVTVLDQGAPIAAGTARDVMRDPKVVSAYLGDEVAQ